MPPDSGALSAVSDELSRSDGEVRPCAPFAFRPGPDDRHVQSQHGAVLTPWVWPTEGLQPAVIDVRRSIVSPRQRSVTKQPEGNLGSGNSRFGDACCSVTAWLFEDSNPASSAGLLERCDVAHHSRCVSEPFRKVPVPISTLLRFRYAATLRMRLTGASTSPLLRPN